MKLNAFQSACFARAELRLAEIDNKLDRLLAILEPQVIAAPAAQPVRNYGPNAPSTGEPDENGIIWPKPESTTKCKKCKAACIWGYHVDVQGWRPHDPYEPFAKHNCAVRKKQDNASILPPWPGQR